MAEIAVEAVGEGRYRVEVDEGGSQTTHLVTVSPHSGRLGGAAAEDLVEASFRFLLDREPKEAIMGEFELGVISNYFPEYESRIGEYLA